MKINIKIILIIFALTFTSCAEKISHSGTLSNLNIDVNNLNNKKELNKNKQNIIREKILEAFTFYQKSLGTLFQITYLQQTEEQHAQQLYAFLELLELNYWGQQN